MNELEELNAIQLEEVLNLTRDVRARKGRVVLGKDLMHLVGSIPPDDLALMAQVIEEGCERIDPETWDVELS